MSEEDFEVRRPDLLLEEVDRLLPLDRPRTLLARLTGTGSTQGLEAVTELWRDPPREDLDHSDLMEAALLRLGVEQWARTPFAEWPLVVGIVVRPGAVWLSEDEWELLMALRYGRNGFDVRQGEVITVTPAGWLTWPHEAHDRTPAARWAPDVLRPQLVSVP